MAPLALLGPHHAPIPPTPALTAVPALALLLQPPPVAVVAGLAWAGSLTVLVSESGTGKTFVLLGLSAAISGGSDWLGHATTQGSVVYCSYEGDALGLRLQALHAIEGEPLEHLFIIRARDPISPRPLREGELPAVGELVLAEALQALIKDLADTNRPPIRLLVIDTVRASMTGSEDGSDAVSAYLRAVRRLMALLPDAACLLAHHAGWQDGEMPKKRERGSSAWRGNSDGTLYLEQTAFDQDTGIGRLTLTTTKTRDAERPQPLLLLRQRVPLDGVDAHGRPLSSCVIRPDPRTVHDAQQAEADLQRMREATINLKVLTACAGATATSVAHIRAAAGIKQDAVLLSLSRLLTAGLVLHPARKQAPYMLTQAGRDRL